MLLTIMTQNLKNGGVHATGGEDEDRWPLLKQRMKSVQPAPDILVLTEAVDWHRSGHKLLARAMNELDMEALPLAPSSTGHSVCILYRQEVLGRWQRWNSELADKTLHGFGTASFSIGLPQLLSITAAHLTPFGADGALIEASLIASRAYHESPLAIIAGDINYPPARGPEPEYQNMLPYNRASRTMLSNEPNAPLQPDRRVGQKFEQAGFVDAAYHLFERTHDEQLLQRTGTDDRIDQFWVSQPLAEAIVNYWVVGEPADASDHCGIVLQLDTEKIDTSHFWEYR